MRAQWELLGVLWVVKGYRETGPVSQNWRRWCLWSERRSRAQLLLAWRCVPLLGALAVLVGQKGHGAGSEEHEREERVQRGLGFGGSQGQAQEPDRLLSLGADGGSSI